MALPTAQGDRISISRRLNRCDRLDGVIDGGDEERRDRDLDVD